MSRILTFATLVMAACATGSPSADRLPVDAAPPPLQLDVPTLYEGDTVTFSVTGAHAGDMVVVVAERPVTFGQTTCPARLQGECFDMADPRLVGRSRADGVGHAEIVVTLPPQVPLGASLALQAASIGGSGVHVSSRTFAEVYDATCPQTVTDFWAEAEWVRGCRAHSDCGQVLTGTSCGCTRNWVARNGADTTDFYRLLGEASQCGVALFSTCDCPATSGFLCDQGTCTWDYSP